MKSASSKDVETTHSEGANITHCMRFAVILGIIYRKMMPNPLDCTTWSRVLLDLAVSRATYAVSSLCCLKGN